MKMLNEQKTSLTRKMIKDVHKQNISTEIISRKERFLNGKLD